jgi:hypothetical protein
MTTLPPVGVVRVVQGNRPFIGMVRVIRGNRVKRVIRVIAQGECHYKTSVVSRLTP